MTVTTSNNLVISSGNGVTTVFPYNFRMPDISYVRVSIQDKVTGVITLLQPSSYSITGVSATGTGGNVTYPLSGAPLANTKNLIIARIVPYTQDLDITNQDGFYPETVEQELDLIVMQIQQLAERIQRTLSFPIGYTGQPDLPFPDPNKLLGWDATGQKLENKDIVPTGNLVTGPAGRDLLAFNTLRQIQTYVGLAHLENSKLVDLPIVVFVSGQSNTLGHSVDGGDRTTKNDHVWVFEAIPGPGQTQGWKCAGPDSPDWPFLPTGNSYGYQYCDRLQRKTGRTVLMLQVAAGGQPISEWLPGGGGYGGTGSMWSSLAAAHTLALDTPVPGRGDGLTLRQTGRVRADILLWHQGEADANYRPTPYNAGTKEEYMSRFLRFYEAGIDPASVGSSAEPMFWFGTPVLMGELLWGGTNGGAVGVGSPTDDRNDAIAELDRIYPFIAKVSSRNLPSLDNLHFTGSGLVILGDRYFDRMNVFPKPDLRVLPEATNLNTLTIPGTYYHTASTTGAPTINSGFVDYYRQGSSNAFATMVWRQQNGTQTFRRNADVAGVWGAWVDTSPYEAISASNIRVSGKLKLFKGTITVNPASTAAVVLPETMADATFIPNITLITFGGGTPVPWAIVSGKTTTGFTIENKHAVNSMVISWTVFDRVA